MKRDKVNFGIALGMFLSFTFYSYGQLNVETLFKTDFAVRDFQFVNDTIFYIKERDLSFLSDKSKENISLFIGGYGLEFSCLINHNTILVAANELVENKSSIRFFNKSKLKFDHVFYNNNEKILDIEVIDDAKIIAAGLLSKKLVFFDYSNPQRIIKTIELKLDAFCRKVKYIDNKVYFATDKGEIYTYNIYTYKKELIFKAKSVITDFMVEENYLYYSTLNGEIAKVNMLENNKATHFVDNDFVTTFVVDNGHVVCGTWFGNVINLNKKEFEIISNKKVHSRTILRLIKHPNSEFYFSSGLDHTIKKWILN